jgi:hypothetical protein
MLSQMINFLTYHLKILIFKEIPKKELRLEFKQKGKHSFIL